MSPDAVAVAGVERLEEPARRLGLCEATVQHPAALELEGWPPALAWANPCLLDSRGRAREEAIGGGIELGSVPGCPAARLPAGGTDDGALGFGTARERREGGCLLGVLARRRHREPGAAENRADWSGAGRGQVEKPAWELHAIGARVRDEAEDDRDVDETVAGGEVAENIWLLPSERLGRPQAVQLIEQFDGHEADSRLDETSWVIRRGAARVRAQREEGAHGLRRCERDRHPARLRPCKRPHLVPGVWRRRAGEEIVAHGRDLAGRIGGERPLPAVEQIRRMAGADRVSGKGCKYLATE